MQMMKKGRARFREGQGSGREENKTEGTVIDLMSAKLVSGIDLNVG